jgi:uncharacterized membrane protein YbhN (UPF0104 family)
MLLSARKCWPSVFLGLTTLIRVRVDHISFLFILDLVNCYQQIAIFVLAKLTKHIYNAPVLKKKIVNILKYSLFTSLGVLLFWLVYRGQDFGNIWHTLRFEVDYRWVALSVFLGILSHISRSMRWLIALEPLGEKPRKSNTFIAVIMGYFMNLLLPRMGEVARCVVLNRYEKISLPKLLGTVITERIVDVVVLFLFTAVVVLFDLAGLSNL